MDDKRLRRRCRNCGERVNLKIFRREKFLYIKCPSCWAEAKYFNQNSYEKRKANI